MDSNIRRSNCIKIRVTDDEKKVIYDKAELAGCNVADLIRQSLCRVKTWTAKDKEIERERIREIRRIGQNLNQIAKWCNQYKAVAESAQVLIQLVAIEQNLQKLLSYGVYKSRNNSITSSVVSDAH